MCGGPPKEQKQAMQSQSQLANTLSGIATERSALQTPFLRSRLQGGLPFLPQLLDYQGGAQARAFAPARARLKGRLDQYGSSLPSGFREQALSDFEAKRARSFDDSVIQALMLDEQTRSNAAGQLNPLGYFSGAQQGFGDILNTQYQPSPWGAIAGGVTSAVLGLLGGGEGG